MNVDSRSELTFISVCTGGGGLDLGIGLALPGARAVCYVEREAFACTHLVAAMRAGFMDEAPLWSDAGNFDGRAWRGCVDGLIGGIPCQPHSLAGKRLGADDERDLWSAFRRTLVQSGAWWCLVENVPGMLSSGGAERVWRDLRRLGFAVEGGLFSAEEVGWTQKRERLFILAVADDQGERRRKGGAEPVLRLGRGVSCRESHELAGPGGARLEGGEFARTPGSGKGTQAPRPVAEFCRAPVEGASRRAGWIHAGQGRSVPAETDARRSGFGLSPPGPDELDHWRHIGNSGGLAFFPALPQSAFRGMADGLASRVDAVRMLGNGVHPLAAGYAIRTLATRLASAGSAGADELVRMMEAAE